MDLGIATVVRILNGATKVPVEVTADAAAQKLLAELARSAGRTVERSPAGIFLTPPVDQPGGEQRAIPDVPDVPDVLDVPDVPAGPKPQRTRGNGKVKPRAVRKYPTLSTTFLQGSLSGQIKAVFKSRETNPHSVRRPNRPSQSCSPCKTTNGPSLSVRPRRDTRSPRSFSDIRDHHLRTSRIQGGLQNPLAEMAVPLHRRLNLRLSVGAAVDSQVRAGDIRCLRTSHKRDQRGDFVNRSVAVERCVGLLGHSPFASGEEFKSVSIGPGWILLTVMPRLPTSLDNPLSEHLDRSLLWPSRARGRRHGTLAYARADHDDAAAALHLLQRRLRRDEDAAHVESSVVSSNLLATAVPALFTRTSSRPNVATVFSTAASTASASVASA